jgi:hypothetical protein
LGDHLKTLAKLRDDATTANHFSAAITAEVNRGKEVAGFYDEKARANEEKKNPLLSLIHRLSGKSLSLVPVIDEDDDDD